MTEPLTPSTSSLYAGNGSNSVWQDRLHDWYVALSASPDSSGDKTQYGRTPLEFL